GNDTASYAAATAGVIVRMDGVASGGGEALGDTLTSIERVIGSAFADTITGSAGNDRIEGGAGDDTLQGNDGVDQLFGDSGNDILSGGLGADMLDGGAGIDVADYSASTSGVTASLDGTAGIGGDADGDTLANIETL